MSDWIRLCDLKFQACHGALSHEKTVPQPFSVDVAVALDLTRAGETDQLADTLNYADIVDNVAAVLMGPPQNLLERLAANIAYKILGADPRVREVVVRVTKMSPPIAAFGGRAEVEVRRRSEPRATDSP